MDQITLVRNDANYKDEPITLNRAHAVKLMATQLRTGNTHYTLPKDSKLEFKDGDFRTKTSTRTPAKPSTRRSNRESEKS